MPSKAFNTKAEADRFERDLPPCKSITRSYIGSLAIKLTWEPIKLARDKRPHQQFQVVRETEHGYIIRDITGLMLKVNRYTLLGNGERFNMV